MKNIAYLLLMSIALLGLASTASASCTKDEDCNNGKCTPANRTSICVCNKGFVTFGTAPCNYKQKEKLTAFLLSFLIGNLGADWFYLAEGNSSYITAGVFKLLTGLFFIFGSCLLCCAGLCAGVRESVSAKTLGMVCGIVVIILIVLCSVTNGIWYLVDWIRILTNSFKDGNGVSLKDW